MNLHCMSGRVIVTALFITFLGVGCGKQSPETQIASAKEMLAKGKTSDAVLQLKNSLQEKPDFAEARFLLGKVYLESGEFSSAEVELRKAIEYKHSFQEAFPLLINAMLASGKLAKVIEEGVNPKLLGGDARAEVNAAMATAFFMQGKRTESQQAVDKALSENPKQTAALTVLARLKAAGGDSSEALGVIRKVLSNEPGNAYAKKLEADLLLSLGKVDEAIAAFRKAVELRPQFLEAHSALIVTLLQSGKLQEGEAQLAQMQKASANHPQTILIQTLVRFAKRDFKSARESGQALIRLVPENAAALQLVGAIEYSSGSYVVAESYLSKSLRAEPNLITARRWLAMTYMATGQAAKARGVLEPVLSAIDKNPDMLALAGDIFMQLGESKRGEEYFLRASKLDPTDPSKRTVLAMARFAKGETESAITDLSSISAEDRGIVADMALVATHMRRGEFDKALRVIDIIDKKRPNVPETHNLRGRALVAKKDVPAARKSFEKAVELSPAYYPATAALAGLDLAENKLDDAMRRFEKLLAIDAGNSNAILALADLKSRSKAPAETVIGLLEKAIALNPADSEPRVTLVSYLLGARDVRKALSVAQSALAALPDNADILDVLGAAQSQSGDSNQAIATYRKLAAVRPDSPQAYMRMAEINMSERNVTAAAENLRKALEIKPGLVAAQQGLVKLKVDGGKPQDAIDIAREVQKQNPKDAIGFLLEGDLNVGKKSWGEAANAYKEGLKHSPQSTELALKYYKSLTQAGKSVDAEKFSATWRNANPTDYTFQFGMGDLALARKEFKLAISFYRGLFGTPVETPLLYNNLAWALGQDKDPGAIEFAEKANAKFPNQPAFMDTLAMLLAGKGEVEKAIEISRKALELAPKFAAIRLNYARILIQAGKKADAERELSDLAKLGTSFSDQGEVEKLRRSIQ